MSQQPRPIRVLHIITRMVRGGAQENTLANVAGLHGPEWESCLVTGPALGPEGSLETKCEAAGIRMLHVPSLVREISPRQDRIALAHLVRILRQERPHLVHTHTSKAGILGRLAARIARVPVVIHTPHGHVFHSYEGKLKSKVFVGVERSCASMAQRLVALTDREMQEHLELGVGRPEQWSIIHSGVDFRPFEAARGGGERVRAELGIPPQAPVVGTVGRLVAIKGQEFLLEAAASLAGEFPDLHLLMVGDGPLRTQLLEMARGAGLNTVEHPAPGVAGETLRTSGSAAPAPTVHFVGLRKDVGRMLSAMDVFALPSLNEGMGRVLVEAMAMELPCVASQVSGIPDVVEDGSTGLLVPARDAASLSGALRRLLASPDLARAMGQRGRARAVPGYSVEEMLAQLERLYRQALRERGIVPPAATENIDPGDCRRTLPVADGGEAVSRR